jgi:hypothetical protein
MGRTYSEYPFEDPQTTVAVRGSGLRLGNDEDKQKVTQQQANLRDTGIHYGQPHAETIQRYQQKRAARQAEAQRVEDGRRAAAKKAPATRKTATRKTATAKKAAAKKAPMVKAAPAAAAKKSTGRTKATSAKTPARGSKVLSRVAAAAKTTVRRVAKKVPMPKGLKKR